MKTAGEMTPSQLTGKRKENRGDNIPRGKWQLKDGVNGRIFFPLTAVRIERWIKEGRVKEDDKVWRSGFSGWKKISETDKFKSHFEKRNSTPRRKSEKRRRSDS